MESHLTIIFVGRVATSPTMRNCVVIAGFLILFTAGCLPSPQEVPGRDGLPLPNGVELRPIEFESRVVASGFHTPWSIEVIGDEQYLVSDRMGELVFVDRGNMVKLAGIPETRTFKADRHYGGLMDVSLHPDFQSNQSVYVAYVDTDYKMVVGRFAFRDRSVQDFEVVFRSNEFSIGSRVEWQDSEHFFVSQGMGGTPLPDLGPQDLNSDGGKIHRLKADGSIPSDNPVFEEIGQPSSIWSYGHRDPQGLYFDHSTNVLYSTEHGPLGGDELNIVQKGGNYGWPRFSNGLNYDGSVVGDLSEAEADVLTILPAKAWGPTFNMAPSSLSRVDLPGLGSQFVWGSLAQQRLIAYDLASNRTSIVLDNFGRIREVKQLPGGDLLLVVDSESSYSTYSGSLVRIAFK